MSSKASLRNIKRKGFRDMRKDLKSELGLFQKSRRLYLILQINKLFDIGESGKMDMPIEEFKAILKDYADNNKRPEIK